MNVPYNNGKVSIGKYYQKPQYVEYDDDMLTIQASMIFKRSYFRTQLLWKVGYGVLLFTTIALLCLV